MKINKNTVIGVLVVVLAYDCKVAIRNRKAFAKNQALFKELLEDYEKAAELTRFYADKLNQHRVPFDNFDQIIMENLIN